MSLVAVLGTVSKRELGETVWKVKYSSVRIENPLLALYRGTEYFSLARTFRTVWGGDPRQRRRRDSTDRCVPIRSPLTIRRPKGLSAAKSEKIIIPQSPLQRPDDLIHHRYSPIYVSKTGRYGFISIIT